MRENRGNRNGFKMPLVQQSGRRAREALRQFAELKWSTTTQKPPNDACLRDDIGSSSFAPQDDPFARWSPTTSVEGCDAETVRGGTGAMCDLIRRNTLKNLGSAVISGGQCTP